MHLARHDEAHWKWAKKTLADILGDDRGLPDYVVEPFLAFVQEDIDALRKNERQAVFGAIKRVAHESRDMRGGSLGEGADRPAWVESDMDWALRAAKSALEAVPMGQRSERAEKLLSECTCPAATGPQPGVDDRTVGEMGMHRPVRAGRE
ncbi:MAG: hypothetical protein ACU0CO_14860 [Shimia sp.]